MNRFVGETAPIFGLTLIKRKVLGDERGFLTRLFCPTEFIDYGWNKEIRQINHTYTAKKGTIRGMHFQHVPYSEMKLVTCFSGSIFDVAVDLRKGSPTFLQWFGTELSRNNETALLIPQGFAHGYQALSDDVELLYLHSEDFRAESEDGLNAFDPRLGIDWPLEMTEISKRDQDHPYLDQAFIGIEL